MEGKKLSALDALQWSKLPPHVDYVIFLDWGKRERRKTWYPIKYTVYDPNKEASCIKDCLVTKKGSQKEPLLPYVLSVVLKMKQSSVVATVDWADYMFMRRNAGYYLKVVFFGKERSKGGVQLDWMMYRYNLIPYCLRFGEHQVVAMPEYDEKFTYDDVIFNLALKPCPFHLMAQKGVEKVKGVYWGINNFVKYKLQDLEGKRITTVEKCDFHYLDELTKWMDFEIVYEGIQFSKENVMEAFRVKRQLNTK